MGDSPPNRREFQDRVDIHTALRGDGQGSGCGNSLAHMLLPQEGPTILSNQQVPVIRGEEPGFTSLNWRNVQLLAVPVRVYSDKRDVYAVLGSRLLNRVGCAPDFGSNETFRCVPGVNLDGGVREEAQQSIQLLLQGHPVGVPDAAPDLKLPRFKMSTRDDATMPTACLHVNPAGEGDFVEHERPWQQQPQTQFVDELHLLPPSTGPVGEESTKDSFHSWGQFAGHFIGVACPFNRDLEGAPLERHRAHSSCRRCELQVTSEPRQASIQQVVDSVANASEAVQVR